MLPMFRSLIALTYLFGVLAGAAGAAVASENAPRVDLAKTLGLFKDWSQRKTFPDSVSIGYYVGYSLRALEGRVPDTVKDRLAAYIRACQQPDGGFVSNRRFGSKANVIYTFYALQALEVVGALDAIEREKTLGFLRQLIRSDGSLTATPDAGAKGDLASTYYGISALRLLGELEVLDRDKTLAFVKGYRTSDEGFGMRTGGASSLQGTFMAVSVLADLAGLDEILVAGATRYLESAIAYAGMKGKRYRALSTMQAAASTLGALERLGTLHEVETDNLELFVLARYVPQNGGFGPREGLGTTPPSTYQGVYCLAALGKLKALTLERAVDRFEQYAGY